MEQIDDTIMNAPREILELAWANSTPSADGKFDRKSVTTDEPQWVCKITSSLRKQLCSAVGTKAFQDDDESTLCAVYSKGIQLGVGLAQVTFLRNGEFSDRELKALYRRQPDFSLPRYIQENLTIVQTCVWYACCAFTVDQTNAFFYGFWRGLNQTRMQEVIRGRGPNKSGLSAAWLYFNKESVKAGHFRTIEEIWNAASKDLGPDAVGDLDSFSRWCRSIGLAVNKPGKHGPRKPDVSA